MKHLFLSFLVFSFLYQNVMSQCTPDAGMDDIACGLTYTLQGTLSQTGSAATWTTSYPGVIFTNPNQLMTEVFVPAFAGSLLSIPFVFAESNGGCTGSDTVIITFLKPPHAEASSNQYICGTTAQLYADTIGSGIVNGYWTSSVPGISITQTGQPPYPEADIDASSLLPGFWINSQREVYFYWHGQNNSGCTSIDSVLITFYEIPQANAGQDTSICGNSWDMTGAWSIDNPSGIWNPIPLSGPGTASFSPNNQPDASVTVTSFGAYSFVWKEMNAGNTSCFDRDTLLIHFLTVPTPDAGMEISVCGKYAHICATQSPGINGGQWNCPTGGVAYYDTANGVITPPNQFQPCTWIRYSSENDTVTMYWSEFNGVCYGYDSINVYFSSIQPAISLVDPADSIICGPTFDLLNAQWPVYGTGHWIDTVVNTVFYPSSSVPSPFATIDTSSTNYYGFHCFRWVTNNGICTDTSVHVVINFIEKPIANAGGNYWPGLFGQGSHIKTDTVCGLNYQMNAVPSVGTGFWYTTLLSAQFGLTNTTSTTIYNDSLYFLNCGCYSVFNSTIQYYEFIWQETDNVCVSSDTLYLYVAPIPTGEFQVNSPTCPQNNFSLIAKTWPLPNNEDYGINSFTWDFPNGTLDPTILNPSTSDSILVSWNSGSEHPVSLITSNVWGCNSLPLTNQLIEPYSGIISGQLTSSPIIDYSAFMINVYRAEINSEAQLVTTYPLSTNGEYNFGVSGSGDFYIQAKQVQSNSNLQFANSYYNNVFEWANAQTINLTCNDSVNVNIPLVGYTPATGGQCRIYGLVRYDGSLDPVQNATVYLRYQPNQDPARFEFTNQNGYYSVNNIPNGNYKLFVDIPGLPQITNHHIIVNPNDTVFANVNFIVDTTSISKQYGFGIYADTTGFINVPLNNTDMMQISVFPIPFNEQLNLSYTLPFTEKISAELIDVNGKAMMIFEERLFENGMVNLSFPTAQLESGIYFLKMEINETVYIKKILKDK